MAYTRYYGGLGISPSGQTECGNAASVIEPRYLISVPADQQHHVALTAALKFITYCFSSWVDIADTTVEIDEGSTGVWTPAFDGENFLSPYDGANSKVIRDGHNLIFYIHKTDDWPKDQKVLIRFEGQDEYGQVASKEAPVVW